MTNDTGRFTVGFVELKGDRSTSKGSGTLVRLGKIGGVLTCAHVLEEILDLEEIGIVYFPVNPHDSQTLRVPKIAVDHVAIGQRPWTEDGPDIGFLRLPITKMAALAAVANVADLGKQRSERNPSDNTDEGPSGHGLS